MKTRLPIKGLLLFFLLVGNMACNDDPIDWNENIIGSTFNNFETVLYVGDIPETVDQSNSVYLYHSGETGSSYAGYFQYQKSPSDKEPVAYLLNKSPIMDAFLEGLADDTSKGIPVLFSGTVYGANQLTTGAPVYSVSITSIRKK